MKSLRVGAFMVLLWVIPAVVGAHEGEQHAEPEVALLSTPGADLVALGVTTEAFEVVIKYPPLSPAEDIPLTLFLSDASTNKPVGGAQIEVQIPDAEVHLTMEATEAPGIYTATLVLPDTGTYDLIAIVTAGEQMDLISMNGLRIGSDVVEVGRWAWKSWVMVFGIALAAVLLVILVRTRANR